MVAQMIVDIGDQHIEDDTPVERVGVRLGDWNELWGHRAAHAWRGFSRTVGPDQPGDVSSRGSRANIVKRQDSSASRAEGAAYPRDPNDRWDITGWRHRSPHTPFAPHPARLAEPSRDRFAPLPACRASTD